MPAFQTVQFQLFEYCNEKKLKNVLFCDNLEIQDDFKNLKYNLLKYSKKPLHDGKRLVSYSKESKHPGGYNSTVGFRCFPDYIINYICRDDQNQAMFKLIQIRGTNAVAISFLYSKCDLICHNIIREYLENKESFDHGVVSQIEDSFRDVLNDSNINNEGLNSLRCDILKKLLPAVKKMFNIKKSKISLCDQILKAIDDVKFYLLFSVQQELQNMGSTTVSITNSSVMIECNYPEGTLQTIAERCYQRLGVRLEIYEKELLTSWIPQYGTENIMTE